MSRVNTNEAKINELLYRGVHDVFTKKELKEKLTSGKKLNIKLGTDVTGANLHLGHAVLHRKLLDFQELGHNVTLIIGDFTTLVGDHSDKVDMRKETNSQEISEFKKHYEKQFFSTVIKDQTTIKNNSNWLKDLNFNDILKLAKEFTIAQMLDRETFLLRYKKNKPIGLDEFLYPLMQGYDSVALNCDVEIGGTDQTFNLLAGRKLMPVFGQTPQTALTMKLLTGSDGRPMGKSLLNFIPILDNPTDMYGKVMSIIDEVVFEYFELVTRVPMSEIQKMRTEVENGGNPMIFKKLLAKEIVTFFHGAKAAETAENTFKETVQNKRISEEFLSQVAPPADATLSDFLKTALSDEQVSGSDIKRVIKQGGVEVNGTKKTDPNETVKFETGTIVKYGKRRFFKVQTKK